MDALRGGFGTIGSIVRARSRRASSINSFRTSRGPNGNAGFDPRDPFSLSNVPRYQLSDRPPSSNPNSLRAPSVHGHDYADRQDQYPPRAGSLRFDPEDVVHRVGRAGHPEEAIHSTQLHLPPSSSSTYHQPTSSARPPSRSNTGDMSIVSIPEDMPIEQQMLSPRQASSFGGQIKSAPPQIVSFSLFFFSFLCSSSIAYVLFIHSGSIRPFRIQALAGGRSRTEQSV